MLYTARHIAEIVHSPSLVSDRAIVNILLDSRKVYSPADSVFFAIKGVRRNGNDFVRELYDKLVRCFVVTELPDPSLFPEADFIVVPDALEALQLLAGWHRRLFTIPVIGITGSNGKTIVKEWLYQLLQPEFSIVRSPRSYNSQTGVPLSIWEMNNHHTLAIFEAGISLPGEMQKLEEMIRPTLAVFTNIGEAHSEGFADLASKAAEKANLLVHASAVVYNANNVVLSDAVTGLVNRSKGRNGHKEDSAGSSQEMDLNGHEAGSAGSPQEGDRNGLEAGSAGSSQEKDRNGLEAGSAGSTQTISTSWKYGQPASLCITERVPADKSVALTATWNGSRISITVPFTDKASEENAITCWAVLLQMGYANNIIAERMHGLQSVNMRLEVKQGINNCIVINDSYSADTDSLQIALGFMQQQSQGRLKTVILSDFLQSASTDTALYNEIINSLRDQQVAELIAIGPRISTAMAEAAAEAGQTLTSPIPLPASLKVTSFESTEQFLRSFRASAFRDQIILVKGARVFHFEEIVHLFEVKRHQTLLEINLRAIVHNVKFYQEQLKPTTKIMAMVKAFAYGAGGAEIAGILQFHKVDYLGVAYTDEGVELRKAGIRLPIMVINPEPASFEAIIDYNLEPDLYSMDLLDAFETFIRQEGLPSWPVHIEIETGMNRLGFAPSQVDTLTSKLAGSSWLKVQSVFSHLAASEDGAEDAYTRQQFNTYQQAVKTIAAGLGYPFIRHISNSAAIMRLPELELDMVRLGIGLYGVDSSGKNQPLLQPAATLRSTVAQLKYLKAGDTVGYNRRGRIEHDTVIATVRIGYADGYSRRLGHGAGKMYINGHLAPVVGTVSMDMTMVDVTDIPQVSEGDDVIVFGKELPVQQLALWAGTIPYEIMTGISQRVQRVYFEE